eukprot:1991050-Rhodomonas_salina.1
MRCPGPAGGGAGPAAGPGLRLSFLSLRLPFPRAPQAAPHSEPESTAARPRHSDLHRDLASSIWYAFPQYFRI